MDSNEALIIAQQIISESLKDKRKPSPKGYVPKIIAKFFSGGELVYEEMIEGQDFIPRAKPSESVPHDYRHYQTIKIAGVKRPVTDTVYFSNPDDHNVGIVIDDVTGTYYDVIRVAGNVWKLEG